MNEVVGVGGRATRLCGGLMALLLVLAGGFAVRPGGAVALAQDGDVPNTMTMIVGGLDSRSAEEPENTDVFMIARIDFDARVIRVMSVPRDLFVEIPGFGADKITRAYDFGSKSQGGDPQAGMDLMRATVQYNFGIEVDKVLLTTFDGFVELVDAIGGVEVENPYELYDPNYPTPDRNTTEIFFPAGPIFLNGDDALIFCRSRNMDGDEGRVMRQQLVLRAVLDKMRDPAMLAQAPELVDVFQNAVRTDLSLADMVAVAPLVPEFSNDQVAFGSMLPYLYPSTSPVGAWIYAADWSVLPGYVQGYLDGSVG